MAWLDENLAGVMSNRVPGVKADITNQLILMGHSAAGHSVTQYLNETCGNAKMLVFFSPVDGVDPFGFVGLHHYSWEKAALRNSKPHPRD